MKQTCKNKLSSNKELSEMNVDVDLGGGSKMTLIIDQPTEQYKTMYFLVTSTLYVLVILSKVILSDQGCVTTPIFS